MKFATSHILYYSVTAAVDKIFKIHLEPLYGNHSLRYREIRYCISLLLQHYQLLQELIGKEDYSVL
jgi:hypothetical protein